MDYAFVSAKSAFALVPTLEHPYLSARVSLAVDASDSQVGAVFQQLVWGSLAPLAFYSKKLSSAKTCYSAFDRELLAAFSTVKHFRFRFLLEGWKFTLFTDHKPPTFALFRVSPPWSARQQRHLSYLSEFTSDLVHLPSLQNVVADALSHPSSAASASTVVQVSGLNPFREFLLGSAQSCLILPFPVSAMQPLSSASSVDFF